MVRTYESTGLKFKIEAGDVERKVKAACEKLKARRDDGRPRPGLDDKVLCGWNGLMVRVAAASKDIGANQQVSALAKASQVLPESYPISTKCLPAAEGVIAFIKQNMWDTTTRTLYRSWREGKGPIGQTDDYAFLIKGLLDLYEASGKEEYALFAVELQSRQDELFWDKDGGGYFASAPDEHVLIRMKDAQVRQVIWMKLRYRTQRNRLLLLSRHTIILDCR
jgi:uncharacterized protein YyaL (SSP411 family)